MRLETAEGRLVAQEPANSAGQVQFAHLGNTTYRLTATADGFQATQQLFPECEKILQNAASQRPGRFTISLLLISASSNMKKLKKRT